MSQYIEQRMKIILDLNSLTAQTLPLHELTYHFFIFLDSGFWETKHQRRRHVEIPTISDDIDQVEAEACGMD
jgi:hypothetical protein